MTIVSLGIKSQVAQANSISELAPISHWTCDEESGVRYDSNTTNANDLSDVNTVGFTTGLLGNACSVIGANDEYLTLAQGDDTDLDLGSGGTPFSISVWFEPTIWTTTDIGFTIWDRFLGTGNQRSLVGGPIYRASGYDFDLYISTAGTDASQHIIQWETGGWSVDTWYHVVLTHDGASTCYLYINGTSQGSKTCYVPYISTSDLDFPSQDVFLPFTGNFDEWSVFDYALTSGQVTTLYNSGTPLPYIASSSEPTGSTTISYTLEDDNILFALGVIIFFLAFHWFGFVISVFRK